MRLFSNLRRGGLYLLPLAVLLIAISARIVAPDLLDRLSLIAFDLYQRALPRVPGDSPIRIVDIDDKSLAKIGQWPWPRTIVAQLVERLATAGAAVVAFDIDFAEPDRTSPKMLLPLITRNGVDPANAEKLLSALPDPDQRLAMAMRKVPVVTGFILTDQGVRRAPAAKAGFAFTGMTRSAMSTISPGWSPPCRCWKRRPPATGFSTSFPSGIMSSADCR